MLSEFIVVKMIESTALCNCGFLCDLIKEGYKHYGNVWTGLFGSVLSVDCVTVFRDYK